MYTRTTSRLEFTNLTDFEFTGDKKKLFEIKRKHAFLNKSRKIEVARFDTRPADRQRGKQQCSEVAVQENAKIRSIRRPREIDDNRARSSRGEKTADYIIHVQRIRGARG